MARHAGSAAGAVSTAAAAQDQKDPDNFAAPASTAAVVMFETAANAASTAAAENQDEPNEIEASSRPASASTVTTAVCCRYITHVRSSIKRLITLYHMTPGLHMFPVNCKNKGKFYGTCTAGQEDAVFHAGQKKEERQKRWIRIGCIISTPM